MAEEGLSYTIKFIPDVTEIDKSIEDISTRVSKAIKDSIDKARLEAGDTGPAAVGTGAPAGGVIDRIFTEFKSLKERVTSTLKEFNILSGRSRALGHPSSATVGSVVEVAAQKVADGDVSKLSKSQNLQMLSAAIVAGVRAVGAKEGMPGLSSEEAIGRSMQDQLGSLKGTSESMFGLKQFGSMKGLFNMALLSDFYERTLGETGASRVKESEQGLMQSFGHDIMEQVGTAIAKQQGGAADWETREIFFQDLYRSFGMSKEQAASVEGAGFKVADFVRLIDDAFEVYEWKPVADKEGVLGLGKVMDWMNAFLTQINADVEMQKKYTEITGRPFPKGGLTATGEMMAGTTRGTPEKLIQGIQLGEFIEGVEFKDMGEHVKAVILRNFQNQMPEFQQELETLMIDMAPSPARAHVQHLLTIIEENMKVLEAHSLPKFWMDIGVDRWIKQSAIEYVGALKGEITPRLYQVTKEETGLEGSPDEGLGVTTTHPRSDSERILGKLDIMDGKLDDIKGELPRGAGTISGTLIGSMKEGSKGD